MASFTFENLTFTYPHRKKPALSEISLEIREGEWLTVCGKSGSGKTTLLRILKSELAPYGAYAGRLWKDGSEMVLGEQEAQKTPEIGFVMQNPEYQIVTEKVWHELAFGPENLGWSPQTIRMRVAETANYFGIQTWFHKNVNELSGGQKQLLNLAAVMVMQPEVLILDEPTSQLDPIAAEDFLETIRKIHEDTDTTIIMTEHRLDTVLGMSDRMAVLEDGKLLFAEKPEKGILKLAAHRRGKESLFESMPAVSRACFQMADQSGETLERCPVTVAEGRRWLKERMTKESGMKPVTECEHGNATQEKRDREKTAAVVMKDVRFRYEKNADDVLKGAKAELRKGEIFALLGGNGSGKSTLLKVMAGLRKPYRGKVKSEKKILILPQNPQDVFACENVLDELMETASSKDEATEIAAWMGLTHVLTSHPYDLSGGEQQRTALAKMLLAKPEVLLLDEPTKGMDNAFKNRLGNLLLSLAEGGKTILLASHDIEFCAKYADRCAMLFDGAITASGTPKDFFAGNRYYTTACGKMTQGTFVGAVTPEAVAAAYEARKGASQCE